MPWLSCSAPQENTPGECAGRGEVFPDSIWLDVAPSGKHFYAMFEDGIRAALGFDDCSDPQRFRCRHKLPDSGTDPRR